MAANNKTILIGRIGNDPKADTKHLPSGSTITELRLAVNRTAKDAEGNYITDWITVQFWNKQAERIKQYTEKGQMVSVTGSLRIDQWNNNEGERRLKYYISGEEWYGLGGGRKNAANAPTAEKHTYAAQTQAKPAPANNFQMDDGELPPF